MTRDLIRQLKALKHQDVRPSEEWLTNSRRLLLSQIKNTVTPNTERGIGRFDQIWQGLSVFLPRVFVYNILRPALVLVLVFTMGAGGWIATVGASSQSLPGDWLYSAKRAAEMTQVAMANAVGAKNTQVKLHSEFAKRRAVETKKIISTDNPDKMKIAVNTVSDLKNEIQSVNKNLEEIKTSGDSAVSQTAVSVRDSAEQINTVLKEVKDSLLSTDANAATSSQISKDVTEVKNLTKDTAVKAVEVIVAKHMEGDNSLSKEEVKGVIASQLQSAAMDTIVSKQNVEEVNKVMTAVNTEVKVLAKEAVRAGGFTSSTQALSTMMEATAKQTQEAVDKTQIIIDQADVKMTQAQTMLSQDNLAQAVSLVKEMVSTSKQVEQVNEDTLKAIQSVMPVVAVVKDAPATTTINLSTTSPAVSSLGVTVLSTTLRISPVSTTPIKISTSTTRTSTIIFSTTTK